MIITSEKVNSMETLRNKHLDVVCKSADSVEEELTALRDLVSAGDDVFNGNELALERGLISGSWKESVFRTNWMSARKKLDEIRANQVPA